MSSKSIFFQADFLKPRQRDERARSSTRPASSISSGRRHLSHQLLQGPINDDDDADGRRTSFSWLAGWLANVFYSSQRNFRNILPSPSNSKRAGTIGSSRKSNSNADEQRRWISRAVRMRTSARTAANQNYPARKTHKQTRLNIHSHTPS